MADKNVNSQNKNWTSTQAYAFAVICLLLGTAAGYLVRGPSSSVSPPAAVTGTSVGMGTTTGATAQQQPTPEQMAQMANKQVEPLLQQLKTHPNDPALLAKVGNVYFDGQQFDQAISYYQKALNINPQSVEVRSDMATCYWYKNDANSAIHEYEKSLEYNPKHAPTLFNLGIVRWQGKNDPKGAVEAWQRLIDTNPNYEEKARVLELISRARQHASGGMPVPKG